MSWRDMQVGWPGLRRAISLTIVLTSAFWIAIGVWIFHGRMGGHVHSINDAAVPSGESSASLTRPGTSRAMETTGPLRIPVLGVRSTQLVDTFEQARAGGERIHDAIDIVAPEGTPVIAATPGRIEKLFLSNAGGNTIYVRSGDRRLIYYYAHLAAYAAGLHEGMAVRQGQVLGAVGHTGNASAEAPHLHFAMWLADPAQGWSQKTQAIDPYPYLTRKSAAR